MTSLKSHITALGKFLVEQPAEKSSSKSFLEKRIKEEVLTASDVNQIMLVLQQASNVWTASDLQELETLLLAQVDSWNEQRGCGKTQDYSAFLAYFSASDWNRMFFYSDDFQCASYIIKHLGRLGLRLPNEQTALFISSLMLALSKQDHSKDNPVTQHKIFCGIKALCSTMLRTLPRPANKPPWVWVLPESPTDMDSRWMELALGTAVPVPCAINFANVLYWTQEIPCRGNNKKLLAWKAQFEPAKENSTDAVLQALRIVSNRDIDPRMSAQIYMLSPLRKKGRGLRDRSPPGAPVREKLPLPMLKDQSPEKEATSVPKKDAAVAESGLLTAAAQLQYAVAQRTETSETPEVDCSHPSDNALKRPAACLATVEPEPVKRCRQDKGAKTKQGNKSYLPALKRPAAKGAATRKDYNYGDLKDSRGRVLVAKSWRRKHYPEGCSRCRERPGCTLSCYRDRKQLTKC